MNLRLISVEYGMRIKAVMTYKPKLLLQMNCGRKKKYSKIRIALFYEKNVSKPREHLQIRAHAPDVYRVQPTPHTMMAGITSSYLTCSKRKG